MEPIASQKKLLILDLDGTLVSLVSRVETETKFDCMFRIDKDNYYMKFRPGTLEFLSQVSQHYDLAVWSAGQSEYVEQITERLFRNNGFYVKFSWSRSQCVYETICNEMCGISCWTTRWVKPLDKVYEAFPEYNSQNVLIIDDTESTYCKNEENAIPISYWWEGREDDKLSQISDFLIYDLKDLPDVRSFQNKKNYGRLNTKIVDV